MFELRPGQTYRRVTDGGAVLLTVSSIDGTTVDCHQTYESVPGPVAVAVHSPSDFEAMCLIQDPEWSSYRLVVRSDYGVVSELSRRLLNVGRCGGASNGVLTAAGPIPMSWWDVVAPSEEAALGAVRAALTGAQGVDLDSLSVNNAFRLS